VPLSDLTSRNVQALLNFYQNVSLKEEGYQMFNKDGMNAIVRLLNHISTCPQVEKDFINLLAYGVVRYMGKIDKALTEILHTINEWCAQFLV
jgi:hypothetical protein